MCQKTEMIRDRDTVASLREIFSSSVEWKIVLFPSWQWHIYYIHRDFVPWFLFLAITMPLVYIYYTFTDFHFLSFFHPSLCLHPTYPSFCLKFAIVFFLFNLSIFCYISTSSSIPYLTKQQYLWPWFCFMWWTLSSSAWTLPSDYSQLHGHGYKNDSHDCLTPHAWCFLYWLTVWIIHLVADLLAFCKKDSFSYLTPVCI